MLLEAEFKRIYSLNASDVAHWFPTIVLLYMMVCAKSLQLCPTLCDPVDCSLPGSSVHGILQAKIWEWVAIPSCRGSYWPMDQTHVSYVSCTGRQVLFYRKAIHAVVDNPLRSSMSGSTTCPLTIWCVKLSSYLRDTTGIDRFLNYFLSIRTVAI